MRASAATLSFGLGLAVPCIVAVWGLPLSITFYLTLGGASFGIGLVVAAILDLALYRADAESLLRQRNALTDQTMIATLEREARLYPTVAAVETPPTPIDTRQGWYWAVETFLFAGDSGGFSIRRMQGIVGSDTWAQLTSLLADAGWLAKTPGRGYVWADGYSLARAMQELRAERLTFPSGPAPVVNESINDATSRNTTRQPQQA